tara:strand:- start:591 stop:875 length:285 start_codon:yes stop_codon:yes gene_type:complete
MLDSDVQLDAGTIIIIMSRNMCDYYDVSKGSVGIIVCSEHSLMFPYKTTKYVRSKNIKKSRNSNQSFPETSKWMYTVFIEQKEVFLFESEFTIL